jgi:hypothetical protein
MKYKRSYIIDKEFQFKKSFAIIGFVAAIVAVIIVAVGIVLNSNSKKIESNNTFIIDNTKKIQKIFELQQDIIVNFSLMPGSGKTDVYAKTAGKLADDYNKSMDILKAAVDSNSSIQKANRDIMNMNSLLILIIIVITIAGIVFLYIQMIRHTHRISGPIFIMSKYIREILDGKSPDMRDLREKDEFKEYFSLFRQMGERLIELEKKEKKGQGKI